LNQFAKIFVFCNTQDTVELECDDRNLAY